MSDDRSQPGSDGAGDLVELLTADMAQAEAVALELRSLDINAQVFPAGGGWTIAGPDEHMVVMVPRDQHVAALEYLATEYEPASDSEPDATPAVGTPARGRPMPSVCANCSYSLAGLEDVDACPECGRNVFVRGKNEDLVELINTDAIKAHAIAADLESAGIAVKVHELRGFQAETRGWRVFVFGRDIAEARRVLAEGGPASAEPMLECPACGHALDAPAARCPDCGLSLSTSLGHNAKNPDDPQDPGGPQSGAFIDPQDKAKEKSESNVAVLLAIIFGAVFAVLWLARLFM